MLGIRKRKTSWQVFARVHGAFVSRSLPLDATPAELAEAREELKARAKYGLPPPDKQPGRSFTLDAKDYLKLCTHMPSYETKRYHLEQWCAAFGHRPRNTITGRDIRAVLERWRGTGRDDGKGLSVASLNRRRTDLMSLFSVMDGKSAANPVKDVPPYSEHASEQMRAIPLAIWYRLLARMRKSSKTRARLRVMIWTGWPQKQIADLRPIDLDLGHARAKVSRRSKGKGHREKWLPLLPGAVVALEAFAKAGAWGTFSRDSMRTRLHKALEKENAWRELHDHPPLDPIRPYDARHSAATMMAALITDERALQDLLLHGTAKQTRRYTLGADETRMKLAIDRAAEALTGQLSGQLRPSASGIYRPVSGVATPAKQPSKRSDESS